MSESQHKLWLLSAYDSGSHAAWARGYMVHCQHRVILLRMAGRFWKWRMQGGAIELAEQARQALAESGPPDVVLATDMVNVPAWLGLVRRELPAETPIVLYMHENQFTYPWREGEGRDLTYGMINWLSQLAADRICFNSRFHMESWFDELPRMLKHYPDYNHLALLEQVRERSMVLPVGIDCAPFAEERTRAVESDAGPLFLWNQRWEYDKRPDRFFQLLDRLCDARARFRVAVAGQNFRNVPKEFEEARERLGERIVHWGYLDTREAYAELLRQADLVISTADHEFFGISVLEAISAGAYPLLPNRLSYPELIPESMHGECLYDDEDELFRMALDRIDKPRVAAGGLREHVVAQYDWPVVAGVYDNLLSNVLDGQN